MSGKRSEEAERRNSRKQRVRANPDRLATGWQNDEVMRADVYDRVRRLQADGVSQANIARQVGLASRSVARIQARLREGLRTHECGAFNRGQSPLTERCRQPVLGPVTARCRHHEEGTR